MNRRSFLKLLGLSTAAAAVAGTFLEKVGPSPTYLAADVGLNEITYMGFRIVADPLCPPGHAYLISSNDMVIINNIAFNDIKRAAKA